MNYKEYVKELRGLFVFESEHGFVTYKIEGTTAFVRDMYIDKELRRSKLGTELANTFLDNARSLGCTHVIADVEPSSPVSTESLKFLLSLGMSLYEANDDEVTLAMEL